MNSREPRTSAPADPAGTARSEDLPVKDVPVRDVPVKDVLDRMRSQGGRVTTTRRVIVEELLAEEGRHLSAEEVVAGVRSRLPDTAESTVYRTLAALEDLGVIDHVHLGHGPATYHIGRAPHRHLVCTGCGAVTDLPEDAFGSFAESLNDRFGFRLQDEHFALTGLCRACGSAEGAVEQH